MNVMELKAYEILKDKLGEEKMELIKTMKENKTDLIKWMVVFWIAQIAAIIGLYFRGR